MVQNPDGRIAGRSIEDGGITWSHKYDLNLTFTPPHEGQKCDSCGSSLVALDGKWHPVEVRDGRYYCERCSKQP